uniref:Uncharacterized protein n=1 Tax=Sphaerodactylus townsendi TaxID=933632 RepID=A0ACB8ET71_9SAUR
MLMWHKYGGKEKVEALFLLLLDRCRYGKYACELKGADIEDGIYEAMQPDVSAAVPDLEEEPVYVEMALHQAQPNQPYAAVWSTCIWSLVERYCYTVADCQDLRAADSDDESDSGHGLERETYSEEDSQAVNPPPPPPPPEEQCDPLVGDAEKPLYVEELFPYMLLKKAKAAAG